MAFFPHISAYADLADEDTPATTAAGGRHQAGHYTATKVAYLHRLYRLPRKNLVLFCGQPRTYYLCEKYRNEKYRNMENPFKFGVLVDNDFLCH